jgi:hypothetical protein
MMVEVNSDPLSDYSVVGRPKQGMTYLEYMATVVAALLVVGKASTHTFSVSEN